MFLWFIVSIVVLLMGMGAVAFVTLLERKVLGLSQIRLGPNKVTAIGLLQPVADGMKLLTKQNLRTSVSQFSLFFVSPILLIALFLLMWGWVLPWEGNLLLSKHNSLLYFSVLGVGAYSVIMTGWSSTSGFSKLGSMRGVLQSLSYEVALIVVFLFFLFLIKGFNMIGTGIFFNMEMFLVWVIVWVILSLMESNRAPFDLVEGESELISGFNIEMGSLMFVYLFLSEYGMLIVMSMITDLVLTSTISMLTLFLIMTMLLMRSCFPRVRYDSLMSFMWQGLLPIGILLTFFVLF